MAEQNSITTVLYIILLSQKPKGDIKEKNNYQIFLSSELQSPWRPLDKYSLGSGEQRRVSSKTTKGKKRQKKFMLNMKESVTGDRKVIQQHTQDLSTVWYLTIGAANTVLHSIPHNLKSRSSERTNTDSPPPISTIFPLLAVAYTVVIILPLPLNSCYWC